MRSAFIETLEELAAKDSNIFLMNGDLGFSVLESFTEKFPDRSFNMGVAEANMVGSAAGLAMSGKTVFIYSIIPFVTARVFEQIRNDVGLQNANVKIVGVGSGLTYGQLGPTHHSIEDIALMRLIPGMTVFCPGDPKETKIVTRAAAKIKGPVYIRIGKKGEPMVHKSLPRFAATEGAVLAKGNKGTIIATGNMLYTAMETAKLLAKEKINVRVISMPVVKPLDERIVLRAARDTKNIFTLEEHSVIGGLGSAVSEVLMERGGDVKHFKRFGIADVVTRKSGSQEYLRKMHGLTPEQLAKTIKRIIKKK